jgi:hypothetical protein
MEQSLARCIRMRRLVARTHRVAAPTREPSILSRTSNVTSQVNTNLQASCIFGSNSRFVAFAYISYGHRLCQPRRPNRLQRCSQQCLRIQCIKFGMFTMLRIRYYLQQYSKLDDHYYYVCTNYQLRCLYDIESGNLLDSK